MATTGRTSVGGPVNPLRVLLVVHYAPPHIGGIEVVVEEEARALTRLGAVVTVLSSRTGRGSVVPPGAWTRVMVPAVNLVEERFGVPFPLFGPGLLWRCVQRTRHADVVHVHDVFYLTSLAAGLAALVLRKPVVLTQHVDRIPHPSRLVRLVQDAVFGTYGTWLMRRSARVIVVNARVEAFVRDRGVAPEAIELLPNGVDLEGFKPGPADPSAAARTRLGLPPGRPLVLFVGRPVPKKGFDLLLACADPAFDLVIVGGPERRDEVTADGGRIHHLGARRREEMADVYRACDVFCLPSTGEGFPVTVQEAMAAGVPVVMTADPAYDPYGLSGDEVVFVRPARPEVADALARLTDDRDFRERLGAGGRRYAEDRFSWDRHARRLLEIYNEVRGAARCSTTGVTDTGRIAANVPLT